MTDRWQIELEPEVRDWLELLSFRLYRRVEDKADRLLDEPTTPGEPYSRHLGGKLRELRFELDGEAVCIPYWLARAADRSADGVWNSETTDDTRASSCGCDRCVSADSPDR